MPDHPEPHMYQLFKHMSDNHNLTLLESEMNDIVHVVLEMVEDKPFETVKDKPFLTKDQKRVAIAEAIGWTDIRCGDSQFPSYLVGLPPGCSNPIDSRPIPRLLSDLNATHKDSDSNPSLIDILSQAADKCVGATPEVIEREILNVCKRYSQSNDARILALQKQIESKWDGIKRDW